MTCAWRAAQVRVLEVDISTQIDDYKRAIKEHTQKVQHWAQKLLALRETAAQNAELLSSMPGAAAAEAAGEAAGSGAPSLPELSDAELEALDAKELQARRRKPFDRGRDCKDYYCDNQKL